eukprot:scaffold14498_cov61-Attheya_sp.AAC.2
MCDLCYSNNNKCVLNNDGPDQFIDLEYETESSKQQHSGIQIDIFLVLGTKNWMIVAFEAFVVEYSRHEEAVACL